MKTKLQHLAGLALAVLLRCQFAMAQGTFVNLDFESANVPDVPQFQFGADVTASDGIPGWTPSLNGVAVATILHNNVPLSGAAVAIFGPQWASSQILQGNYSVLIASSSAGPVITAAVGQVGLIPPSAKSLTLYLAPASAIQVTFAGQPIPLYPIGAGPNYNVFGGDVTSLAGQTGELRFAAPLGSGAIIDNIIFSPSTIPEPSGAALLAVGLAAAASRRRWRRGQVSAVVLG